MDGSNTTDNEALIMKQLIRKDQELVHLKEKNQPAAQ